MLLCCSCCSIILVGTRQSPSNKRACFMPLTDSDSNSKSLATLWKDERATEIDLFQWCFPNRDLKQLCRSFQSHQTPLTKTGILHSISHLNKPFHNIAVQVIFCYEEILYHRLHVPIRQLLMLPFSVRVCTPTVDFLSCIVLDCLLDTDKTNVWKKDKADSYEIKVYFSLSCLFVHGYCLKITPWVWNLALFSLFYCATIHFVIWVLSINSKVIIFLSANMKSWKLEGILLIDRRQMNGSSWD